MKKNFIPEGNPVLNILGFDDQGETMVTPAKKEEKEVPSRPVVKKEEARPYETKEKKETKREREEEFYSRQKGAYDRASDEGYYSYDPYAHTDLSFRPKEKPETRSKRLNLLVRPSILKEVSAIADRNGISVNELINRLLEACVKNER